MCPRTMPEFSTRPDRTGILFVCLGNICRSPLAEGIFLHLAKARGAAERFDVESCGLGSWHCGEPADHRSIAVARKHGVTLSGRARLVEPRRDFARFDLIVPMDRANRRGLLELGAPAERVRLVRSFDPALAGAPEERLDVPDPYTGGEDHFEEVFVMLRGACEGLLEEMLRRGERA
jgi:protein-tyrosine phosphatase